MSADRTGKPWTEEEKGRLASLVTDGYTKAEIAAVMGRSLSAIKNKVAELKVQEVKTQEEFDPWDIEEMP